MRTYLTSLAFAVIFGLVSCGGGNDVASSGATAVSTMASATADWDGRMLLCFDFSESIISSAPIGKCLLLRRGRAKARAPVPL